MPRIVSQLITAALISVCLGCASHDVMISPRQNEAAIGIDSLLSIREKEQSNSAYLAQIKIRTSEMKKKFKLEIYCRNDSVSFYSPGFLGQGTFKGILWGDSLRFYFPSEKKYYIGLWYKLVDPDLQRWKDVTFLALNLLRGRFIPFGEALSSMGEYPNNRGGADFSAQNDLWGWQFWIKKGNLTQAIYRWRSDDLTVRLVTEDRSKRFPYFRLDRAEIIYRREESRIQIDFIEQKYNLSIPQAKFELGIPSGAEKIDHLLLD